MEPTNSDLNPSDETHALAHVPAWEGGEDAHLDAAYENSGWPGDGSGADDFADYNANEADDYCNE